LTWQSNTDAAGIAAKLKQAAPVLVLTHAKPDGDAAGSTLALARTLRRCGIAAEIAYVGPVPGWLDEIAGSAAGTPRREFAPMKPCEPVDGKPWNGRAPAAVAVVDTGSWQQVAEMKPVLEGRGESVVLVDHHAHGDAEIASARLIRTECASCTEVLAPVCCALLGLPSAARLPLDVATPLYLGLATDTGWFRFSSVTPATLRLAADLREAGVNHTDLYRMIEQQDEISRWKLLGRALNSVQTHDLGKPWGKLSVMRLTLRDFDECGADRNDTGGFADMVLGVKDVGASAVLTEGEVAPGEAPLTKISLRSKPVPQPLDVGTLTKRMGGGGHFHAAGVKVRVGMDEATKMMLEAARGL
jgi:phosphoesterase RecJ-like protein